MNKSELIQLEGKLVRVINDNMTPYLPKGTVARVTKVETPCRLGDEDGDEDSWKATLRLDANVSENPRDPFQDGVWVTDSTDTKLYEDVEDVQETIACEEPSEASMGLVTDRSAPDIGAVIETYIGERVDKALGGIPKGISEEAVETLVDEKLSDKEWVEDNRYEISDIADDSARELFENIDWSYELDGILPDTDDLESRIETLESENEDLVERLDRVEDILTTIRDAFKSA